MDTQTQIVLEIPQSDEADLIPFEEFLVGRITPKRFDGSAVIHAVVVLSAVSIKVLGEIVIERIKAQKHVEIIVKGRKVAGLSAENAVQVLQEISKEDS
jgi:hypothetical protein